MKEELEYIICLVGLFCGSITVIINLGLLFNCSFIFYRTIMLAYEICMYCFLACIVYVTFSLIWGDMNA